jgi:polyisoprenoid-binding protein YceI
MTTAVATAVRTLQIDPAHSEVSFQVRHLISKVRGRFADFGGTIEFDEAQPERSSVRLAIQAASIDTSQPERDAHLRSEDFFAADRFPQLTFESTGVTARGTDRFDVAGTLTIRGVAKAIVIPVALLGRARDPWGNEKVAFEGAVALNRKDFGLNWNAAIETGGFLVGDEVKVTLAIQAA